MKVLQTGLPQGAVMSCSLFIIYLSEAIQSVTGVKCLLYADDLVLRHETPKRNAEAKTEKALNVALDVLAEWCDFKCRQQKWHFGPSHCLIRVLTETWSTKNISHSSE